MTFWHCFERLAGGFGGGDDQELDLAEAELVVGDRRDRWGRPP